MRIILPSWSCGFDSRHPLHNLPYRRGFWALCLSVHPLILHSSPRFSFQQLEPHNSFTVTNVAACRGPLASTNFLPDKLANWSADLRFRCTASPKHPGLRPAPQPSGLVAQVRFAHPSSSSERDSAEAVSLPHDSDPDRAGRLRQISRRFSRLFDATDSRLIRAWTVRLSRHPLHQVKALFQNLDQSLRHYRATDGPATQISCPIVAA